MTLHEEIRDLVARGDGMLAERRLRDVVAADSGDAGALQILGAMLLDAGKEDEAHDFLKQAIRLNPDHAVTQINFGDIYFRRGKYEKAIEHFELACRIDPSWDREMRNRIAFCYVRLGRGKDALESLAAIGPALRQAAESLFLDRPIDNFGELNVADLRSFMSLALYIKKLQPAFQAAGELWRHPGVVPSSRELALVIGDLLRRNQNEEAGRIYLDALDAGHPVIDYRPRHDKVSLVAVNKNSADAVRDADSTRYAKSLKRRSSVQVWEPLVVDGALILRGVIVSDSKNAVVFFDLMRQGDHAEPRRIAALRKQAGAAGPRFYEAEVFDLLPGVPYGCRMVMIGAAGEISSGEIIVSMPAYTPSEAVSKAADVVGAGGVVLCGLLATQLPSVRYRFEYGASADALDDATPWKTVPPPRGGRVYDRADRMFNHWIPRSTAMGWRALRSDEAASPDWFNHWAMQLSGPFSKDRNQLNGIGSHEMPLNWSWSHPRYDGTFDQNIHRTLSVSGGVIDLRDAELTFTIQAKDLELRGTALTFWILASGHDDTGTFASQWALTGQPFPDEVLASDSHWHRVVLNLPNNPYAWTYTGNNPKEQGARASRYRRLPLHDTLSRNDGAFVLIFAYGDERKVPLGHLSVYDIAAKYRDCSMLSPASGARLTSWPLSGVCDPLALTNGSRGYDAELWTSGPSPAFPLEFEWALPRPVKVLSFQVNQHPYYPAQNVEVLGRRESDGEWQSLWQGEMNDSRANLSQNPYQYMEILPGTDCNAIRLRILSGHYAERCGLDGFEVFGEGAQFTGDGMPCTVSEEVSGLPLGAPTYFRLVIDEGEDGDVIVGETLAVPIPVSQAPLISSAIP
jgi:tetratricopeptide (TPR) repeat protein